MTTGFGFAVFVEGCEEPPPGPEHCEDPDRLREPDAASIGFRSFGVTANSDGSLCAALGFGASIPVAIDCDRWSEY